MLVAVVVAMFGSTAASSARAVAQPEPTASVSPSQNLLDGGTVSVDGADWPASTSMTVQECAQVGNTPEPECYPPQTVSTNASGSFTTSYVVHRFFDDADCVTTLSVSCFMLVQRADLAPPGYLIAIGFNINSSQGPDLIIKRRSDGTLFFDNYYSTAGASYSHAIVEGGYWTFAVLVQNDGLATTDITVHSRTRFSTAPFTVQYFYGYYDVTAAVTGSGMLLPSVASGESRLLAVRFLFNGPPMPPFQPFADVAMTVTTPRVSIAQDALTLGVVAAAS